MTDMNKQPTLTDAELAPVGLPMMDMDHVATMTGVISVGAAWDATGGGRGKVASRIFGAAGSDIDAAAVLIQDGDPTVLCVGWDENYKNPLHGQPGDGSVIHTGDAVTGQEVQDGDDEAVIVDLDKVPAEFEAIVIEVAAFKKKNKIKGDQGFQGAANVLFTVYNGRPEQKDKQFCIRPSLVGRENCVIVCVLTRVKDGQGRPTTTWELRKRRTRVSVEHGNVSALINAATAAFQAQQ